MPKNPIVDLPLSQVMRSEIAQTLQQVLKIYTVGNLLTAWRSPKNQRNIEQVFDSPEQARACFGGLRRLARIPDAGLVIAAHRMVAA